MSAQFNALSGAELKAIILDRISKELDDSGEFSPNLSYPWIKWDFQVRVTTYPKHPVENEPEVVAEGTIENNINHELLAETETVEVSVPEPIIIDTPDQARVDADLPLPTPVPVVNVGVVDKPVKQAKRGK
jgi:hypothetical protein